MSCCFLEPVPEGFNGAKIQTSRHCVVKYIIEAEWKQN